MGDLRDAQPLVPELTGPGRSRLGGPLLPAVIDAASFGHRDARGRTFPPIFQLDLGQAEQDAGDHAADRAAEVDLLRHHHDADTAFAPVGQQADAFVLTPRDPVELPHHDRADFAVEDRPLHAVEIGALQRRAAFVIFKPAYRRRFDAMVRQPTLNLSPLAVVLLAA